MQRLRVAFVISARALTADGRGQAPRLPSRWHHDADVVASAIYLPSSGRLASLPALARHVASADLVHVVSAFPTPLFDDTLATFSVARALGCPVIQSFEVPDGAAAATRVSVLRHAFGAALTVVPSSDIVDALDRSAVPATMIPEPIDADEFPFREREPLRPRLLSVGGFEPLDNVAATIRAFAIVQQRWPDATLTLIGRGPQETTLRALVAELGLRHVLFVASGAHVDLPRAYAEHDIFVQGANVDLTATSVLRSFASGLPVVSTAAGAVPAVLTHGVHGLLAPLAEYETIGHHVRRLLDDPAYARALARNARALSEAYYWPQIREQWLNAYDRARGDAGRRAAAGRRRALFDVVRPDTHVQPAARRNDRPAAARHSS